MRKCISLVLIFVLTTASYAQESYGKSVRTGQAAGYGSRDATVLSMMGWGLGLAVGIAALCALIDDNDGSGGGGNHSH